MYLQWNLSKAATQRKTQKYVLKTDIRLMQTFIKLPFVIKIFVLTIFIGFFTQISLYIWNLKHLLCNQWEELKTIWQKWSINIIVCPK